MPVDAALAAVSATATAPADGCGSAPSPAAPAAPAAATAIDPASESFAFDADAWPDEEYWDFAAAVADLRRSFAQGLRAHDGRLGASARKLLRSDGGWSAAALLSWAHHSGRTALLLPMLALLPAPVRDSLLRYLLRFTPHLPLLHSLLAICPQLNGQLDTPARRLALLRCLCAGAQPNLAALRWLLDSLQDLPAELRSDMIADDRRGPDGDGLHPLNSLVRMRQLRTIISRPALANCRRHSEPRRRTWPIAHGTVRVVCLLSFDWPH